MSDQSQQTDPLESNPTMAHKKDIKEIQEDVSLLLRYAISQANIDVKDDLISSTTPILDKASSQLTDDDKIKLWQSYNKLSIIVHPANIECLRIGSKIKVGHYLFLLCLFVFLFISMQTYVIFLTDIIRDAEKYENLLESVTTQIDNLQKANPDIETPLDRQQVIIEYQVEAAYYNLLIYCKPLRWFYSISEVDNSETTTQFQSLKPKILEPKKINWLMKPLWERFAVKESVKSVLQVINYYILPLILGLLGAIAYVVRRLLTSLAENSYTLVSSNRYWMRLALGALLGAISGIILSPDIPQLESLKLSFVLFAFLMGYSVEFAFSLFDSIIDKSRLMFKANPAPVNPA